MGDDTSGRWLRISLIYLCISIFCAFFGAVYEHFSHEVYSYYMLYAFAFPLVGGTLPFSLIAALRARAPGRLAQNLYHAGIAALTVGCIFTGVLEIYGTTNSLVNVYWAIGGGLVIAGVAAYAATLVTRLQ